MKPTLTRSLQKPRLNALAACVAMALTVGSIASASAADTNLQQHWGEGRAALHDMTRGTLALSVLPSPSANKPVTSCADDGSAGTLRKVIAAATSGDVVDLSALPCSTITLATGVININQANLTLSGPADGHLTIDAGTSSKGILYSSASGTLTLQNLTLANSNYTGFYPIGGAVFSANNIVLTNMTLLNNTATGTAAQGAAVAVNGTAVVTNSVFTGNEVHVTSGSHIGNAGALFAGKGVTVTNSTFSGNSAIADAGFVAYGGAIATSSTSTISSSTFSNNSATTGGGAIAQLTPAAAITLTNVTLSGNSTNGAGGGVFVAAPMHIFNSTIAFNSGTSGAGGIYSKAATELESTIVSNNTSASLVADGNISGKSGGVLSGNNNVIPSSGLTVPAGTISVDPALLPLADNGGPDAVVHPKTHALPAASSAIDAGNNIAVLGTDERGHARVFGAAADVGAFEFDDTIFRDSF